MATKPDPKIDLLRAFFERRHPGYDCNLRHWLFLKASYKGGRAWFYENIFRYVKEGNEEFKNRLERAYRFNHTREAVDLVQKYLFKAGIARKVDGADEVIKEFWKSTTLAGLDINQFMRQVSTGNSIGGRVAVVIDNNMPASDKDAKVISIADAKKGAFRIYAYMVPVEEILDYAFDEDGDGGLLWIKLLERVRDDADPINSSGEIRERIRLWTRTEWILYEDQEITIGRGATREQIRKVIEIDRGSHNLGVVPVILADHTISEDPYCVPSLIDDIAYLDRAATNYLSNLDAIIQDQTFSQLAMPATGLMPGEDKYEKVLELGTKRIFIYDPGAGSTAEPKFLSPDPKQAGVILSVINKIINEIYHTIGLAGERTKEDNAVGIDNSSGVAKAYDFERVNSLLLSKAGSCQNVENKMVNLVCLWAGKKPPEDNLVTYPTTFDVMRLVDDLVTAEALGKLAAPAELRREQMREMVDKMFPQLREDLKIKIMEDINNWLTDADPSFAPPSSFGDQPTAKQPRQGQVTKDTPPKKPAASAA